MPLNFADVAMRDLLPDVPGLWGPGDGSLLGVLVSHGHADHVGLADLVDPSVPLYCGAATERISQVASFFVPRGHMINATGHLNDGEVLELGPFRITPVLVDHSAFDAYALIVEADHRRLVYSGDLRGHGRKPSTLRRLAKRGAGANVLVLEGTRLGRPETEHVSETDVEMQIASLCRRTAGWVLAAASAQNVDRLVTLFRAAKRSGRELVLDLYAAHILAACERNTLPQHHWDGVRVFLPSSQRRRVIDEQQFHLTDQVKADRIYDDELYERARELVLLFRESMTRDLERIGIPEESALVWSMWRGYLDNTSGRRLEAFRQRHGIELTFAHASGHASAQDLRELVVALRPHRVVPIHTEAPEEYAILGIAERRMDGEWFTI